jgi:hypothetical protein
MNLQSRDPKDTLEVVDENYGAGWYFNSYSRQISKLNGYPASLFGKFTQKPVKYKVKHRFNDGPSYDLLLKAKSLATNSLGECI